MPDGRLAYHVFETDAGFCAIAWRKSGVVAFRLPERSAGRAGEAMLRRLPDAVPTPPDAPIAAVIGKVCSYFRGDAVDFSDAPIDLGRKDAFQARVYEAVRALDWGRTTTYGALARELGAGPEAARAVGQAMATNPIPLIIPCHRVLAAGNKIGGFSAPGGSASKRRMLEMEGVRLDPPRPVQQELAF